MSTSQHPCRVARGAALGILAMLLAGCATRQPNFSDQPAPASYSFSLISVNVSPHVGVNWRSQMESSGGRMDVTGGGDVDAKGTVPFP